MTETAKIALLWAIFHRLSEKNKDAAIALTAALGAGRNTTDNTDGRRCGVSGGEGRGRGGKQGC